MSINPSYRLNIPIDMGGIYIFNLDRYFDYHMDFETLKRNIKLTSGIELTRDIPNLKYKINRYREVWRKAENKRQIR